MSKAQIGEIWITDNCIVKITAMDSHLEDCHGECTVYDTLLDLEKGIKKGTTSFTNDWLIKRLSKEETPEYWL